MKRPMLILACAVILIINAQADVLYVYSHGLGGSSASIKYYENVQQPHWNKTDNAGWIMQQPAFSFNFPDATGGFSGRKACLSQQLEIDTLAKIYYSMAGKAEKYVLFGVSRGAAVSLSFAGQCNPTHLAAVVAESPFDSVHNIMNTRLAQQRVHWIPDFITRTAPKMVCWQYNPSGITPLQLVSSIDLNVPVLMICSLPDRVVPAESTVNLYLKMRQSGHTHVYLLMLDRGSHVNMLWEEDGDIYMYALHAFYQKYDLPHIPEYAAKGAGYFAQCQPNTEVVNRALKMNRSYIRRG